MHRLIHAAGARLRRLGLFAKINLAIVFVMTFVLILVARLLINVSVTPSLEKDRLLNEEANLKLLDVVSGKYNLIYNQSNLVLSSGHVGDKLDMARITPGSLYEYENTKFIVNYLNALLFSDSDIVDVALLTLDSSINFARSSVAGRTVGTSFAYTELPEMQEFLAQDRRIFVYYDASPAYVNSGSEPVVTFLAKVYSPILLPKKNPIGILMVNYPLSVFADAYQQLGALSGGAVYVLNSSSRVVFSNDPGALGLLFEATSRPKGASELSTHVVGVSGLQVVGILSEDILHSASKTLVLPLLAILISSVGLMLLVVLFLNRHYQKKLNLLADAMEQAAESGLRIRLPAARQEDELGRLSMHFNSMCENLDKYIDMHYKAEVARRTAELNALQVQINPHFLFNTIESIRMRALEVSDVDAANMLMKLGNLFRWMILMDQRIVYLEDEVDYNESYLSLQRIRYEDSLESEIDIDGEALYLGVPKFILQPIVENALQHGLQENGIAGRISIVARIREQTLRITVTDNGSGMPADRLRRLERHIHGEEKDPQFGIGIRNVHSRIRMLFGPPYGVEVESAPGLGTTVTISLPAIPKKEMERNVSNDYRG